MEFFNVFTIFLQFSITRRVRTERNDNFYFLPFSSLMVFFNFFNFFAVFLEFSISRRVGMERNGTIIIVFSVSRPFPTCFTLKGCHIGTFLIFRIFLLFVWNFLLHVL